MSLRGGITDAQIARARRLPPTVSYLVAVSAALVAAFARYALDSIWGSSNLPYITFYPAVALAAWLGGLGAGLVATAVSAVCALLFLPPLGSLLMEDPGNFIGLAVFSLMNVFIAVLNEALHRAWRRAEVAREGLRQSAERLRGIVTSVSDAIITIDAAQKIMLFSTGAEATFGYSAAEMIGQPLDRLIPERFHEVHRRHIKAYGATGVSVRPMGAERVLTGVRRDGEEFPMEARISQVEVGGEKLYTVILRDITERKRAEVERERLREREQASERAVQMARQALTATEARAAATVEAALDAIITIDHEGRVMEFNPAAEKTFGYARDEATGRPLTDLVIPAALRERHRAGLARYLARGESEIFGRRVELTAMRSDGSEFPVELTVVPIRRGDQVIFTGFVRDITERKRIEAEREELLALLQRERIQSIAEDALTATPFNQFLRWLASQVCSILKVETATILLEDSEATPRIRATAGQGKRLRGHVHAPFENEFAKRIATERRLIILNEDQIDEHIREKGIRSMAGVPLLSSDGRVLGVLQIGSAQPAKYRSYEIRLLELTAGRVAHGIERAQRRWADHHARAEAEAVATVEREARQAAEAANRAKDAFLAIVSHELRTPLSAILMWARMVQQGILGSDQVAHGMEVIERSARSQAQLIEDLLDVSRIVAGKMRLEVRPVIVAPIIETAVDIVRPAADAKGVRLRTVLDTDVGAVLGDEERLQQVVSNLLSNAVKFTPKGGRVQVALERVNSHIEIAVSDTGQGIDPAFLPYVFERFRQAEGGTSRAHGGLGLGLAIVRHLVEAHGGTVHAESRGPGQGAVFTVKLPLMRAWTADEAERRHPTAGVAGNGRDLQRLDGLRILLVDDEPDSNDAVGTLLASCGADVRAAGSAEQARDILADWKAEVLVSDVGMPGEDGYRLISSLRTREGEVARIPAVALTAYASREDKVRLLSAGFQAHVPKPVDAAELVTVITSLGGAKSFEAERGPQSSRR